MDKDFKFGFHCNKNDIKKFSEDLEITAAQVFLGSPRSWKRPDNLTASTINNPKNIDIFVHSNYLINPCSTSEDNRVKSIQALQKELDNASIIGARGLVVHGGQAGKTASMDEAIKYWVEGVSKLDFNVPLLIENTAGGMTAPGRYLKDFSKLLEELKEVNSQVGYCLDTCHAWAGGFGLENLHERLLDVVGVPPQLIHLNGSGDGRDSGRDHHSNLVVGDVQTEEALEFVGESGVPVILETPGGSGGMSDIALLKDRFNI